MSYPNSASTFTRVHNYLDLVLETQINPIYTDLEQIESDLIGNNISANLKAPNIVAGTFIQGTTPFAGGLFSRLNNMDAGLYETYNNRVFSNGLGAISTLPANIATTPLTIRGAGSSSTLTNVTTDGTIITYTGSNNFVAGQLVTISNVVSVKTYSSFSATTGGGSQSYLAAITFTGTHGIASAQLPARASIVVGSQSAVTGTLKYFDSTHLTFVQDGPAKKLAYVTGASSSGSIVTITGDGSYVAQGMTMVVLTGTGQLAGTTTVSSISGSAITVSPTPTAPLVTGAQVMFYWAGTTTVVTLTSLFNLTNATIAVSPAPTTSQFSVTSSQAPNGTTYTSGGTAVSKQNSTGLTDWKTYDGTTATIVASVDSTGTFIGALNGGTAASTYNN